ncbi:MAG: histidinol phosphatase [Bacilli bacterium]
MRIDLHCHTKKIKKGDAHTRNVTKELFQEKVEAADVKIIAITNHNHFDCEQYVELKEAVCGFSDIWPGVELDIKGNKTNRGHLIVIANPKNYILFDKKINELIGEQNPDDFLVDVKTVFETLNECDTLYIPHFHKEPKLSDEDTEELNELLVDKTRLFKETSDYRSLGVFSNFDYSVIIGSDIQNWQNYEESKFADIRLPIQTFEQFCLLAKKDKQIINTLLNQKNKSTIEVSPHKKVKFSIPIYEDVNVIFGQKGTGKSEIITSLKEKYEHNGTTYKCYVGTSKDDDFKKLLSTDEIKCNLSNLGLKDMKQQFTNIYDWQDKCATSFVKYKDWWETKDNNLNKKRMRIADCVKIEQKKKDIKISSDYKKIKEFMKSPFFEIKFSQYLSYKDVSDLENLLQRLQDSVENKNLESWKSENTINLSNWSIEKIKGIADKCSNTVSRPITTGFYEYAMNRFELVDEIGIIKDAFETEEFNEEKLLGTLEEKGDIYIQTKYRLLCKNSLTNEFRLGINKLKACKQTIEEIDEKITSESIGEKITEFRSYVEDGIKEISEFIGISRDTVLVDGNCYKPSNGERGILLMQNLLDSNSDVYLLDEPELGMGNSYITTTILPKIIGLAKQRKTVIIATHNANLAVATLPYMSILRTHKNGVYSTYVGNAFYDKLINIGDEKDFKSWTLESMHTLEGGKDAFYGRRDIYESGKQDN